MTTTQRRGVTGGTTGVGRAVVRLAEEGFDVATLANGALKGTALAELAHPKDYAQVLSRAQTDDMVEGEALGPDPKRHLDLIASFAKAGFNQILVHQIGPDQDGFLRFYEKEVMSAVQGEAP